MLQFYIKDEQLARLMPLTREKDNYTIDHQCFILFFNRPDSYYNNVGGNEVIKIVPSQLQRVNMSHSSFFQQDLFIFNVGPRNAMFYDVVLRQRDRLLCSVQKEKNTYKNTKYVCLRHLLALGFLLVLSTSMLLNFAFTVKFSNYSY